MHAYSQDLRDRVLRALDRGEGPSEIAKRYEISRGWVHQVKVRLEREGRRSSLQMGGHRKSRVLEHRDRICAWIREQPDLTLADICARLEKEHGITIKVPALWHQLNNWGLSYKKNSARRRARTRGRSRGEG